MTIFFSIITIVCIACGQSGSADAKPQGSDNMPVNIKAEPTPAQQQKKSEFEKHLPKDFVLPTDDVGKLILREYGAVYVARGGADVNKKVGFKDESEVSAFQNSVKISSEIVGGKKIELQESAMSALRDAMKEIKANKLPLTPRSTNPSRRSYAQTVGNWNGNVRNGFDYWINKAKRVTNEQRDMLTSERDRIQKLDPALQVPAILALEKQNFLFATYWNKSIIYSVAPPGMSQHNLMLAFDTVDFDKPRVREILAKYGWHQTIPSDEPHFTYLGAVTDEELQALGLRKQMVKATNGEIRPFWMPDI